MSKMDFFFPAFPPAIDPDDAIGVAQNYLQTDLGNMKPLLNAWEAVRNQPVAKDPAALLTINFAPEGMVFSEGGLSKYLLRPGISVDACSKLGNDPLFAQEAAELGRWIALCGFNLFYGGGNSGLMGVLKDAFIETRNELVRSGKGFAHQYAIQVFPSCFTSYCEYKNVSGLKASNEGICNTADAAIVTTGGLVNRINNLLNLQVGIFGLVGSMGTLGEEVDAYVRTKIGRFDTPLVLINTKNFYAHLVAHADQIVACELDYPSSREIVHVAPNPAAGMDMMQDLLTAKGFVLNKAYNNQIEAFSKVYDRDVVLGRKVGPTLVAPGRNAYLAQKAAQEGILVVGL